MIQLDAVSGPHKGASFKIDEPSFIIGRARTNRVILLDNKISARHAGIDCREDQYVLRDLNSTNGTFVNGLAVARAVLNAGDELRLGQTVLRVAAIHAGPAARRGKVSISDPAAAAPPAPVQARVRGEAAHPPLEQPPEQTSLPTLVEAYRNLLAMYKMAGLVQASPDLDRLLDEVLGQIFRTFRAERGVIMLFDDETGELAPRASRSQADEPAESEMRISRTIVNQVAARQEAILTTDASLDERWKPADSVIQQDIRSVMCAPLAVRGRVFGVMYVDCRHAAASFKKGDLDLLTAIANEAAVAVENQMLREANVKAERLAAIGQTVANLSHYIKNILTCMQAGSEILTRGVDGGDLAAARKGWAIVHRNERKISDLVLDMLNYSAERRPAKTACNVNNVLEDVAETVRPAAEAAKVRLDLQLDPQLPTVQADPTGVYRCVLNLLTNALDAVEGRPDPAVTVRTAREAESVVIRVADNGQGIPPDIQAKVFDAFFTTKGDRGTGLGLAVVRKIVNEHAGELSVTSKPGEGAEFRIALPLGATDSIGRAGG